MKAALVAWPPLAAVAACGLLDDPDWMVAEARSPDGKQVARIWCENFCDVSGRGALTVSPADRRIQLEDNGSWPPQGRVPQEDRVAAVYGDEETPDWQLRWTGPSRLVVAGRCLTDGNSDAAPPARRSGDITVSFVSLPGPCPEARG